jgi:hypothetical protein
VLKTAGETGYSMGLNVGSEFQVTIAATISHETIWILAVRRWVVGRQKTSAYLLRTERGGFEPPMGCDTHNGLANRRFRPLSHLSRCEGCQTAPRQPRLLVSKRTKPARYQSIARFQAPDAFQREGVAGGKRVGGWG